MTASSSRSPRTELAALTPAERHRAVAGRFAAVVASVDDWSAPTPVAEWSARDVVGHLTEWFPAFLAAGGVDLDAGPPVAEDPVAAWAHQRAGVQALLDDADRAGSSFTHPFAGTHVLAEAVDRFYTADVFQHTWDLARSAGEDDRLDDGWATELRVGMAEIDDLLRSSGQYGAEVPVPDDADATDRLVGFIGRDPGWRPPS